MQTNADVDQMSTLGESTGMLKHTLKSISHTTISIPTLTHTHTYTYLPPPHLHPSLSPPHLHPSPSPTPTPISLPSHPHSHSTPHTHSRLINNLISCNIDPTDGEQGYAALIKEAGQVNPSELVCPKLTARAYQLSQRPDRAHRFTLAKAYTAPHSRE